MLGVRSPAGYEQAQALAAQQQQLAQQQQAQEQQQQTLEQQQQTIEGQQQTIEGQQQTIEQQQTTIEGQQTTIEGLTSRLENQDAQKVIQMIDADELTHFSDATGLGSAHWLGWALCDGRNDTPDLRARFIAGYDPARAEYFAGSTGGEESVALTVDQMPAHNHAPDADYIGLLKVSGVGTVGSIDPDPTLIEPDLMSMGNIADAGGDQAHENRPPFYVLAFIKKL